MAILGIFMVGQPDPSMPIGYHWHFFSQNTDTMKLSVESTVALYHMVVMKVTKSENVTVEKHGIECSQQRLEANRPVVPSRRCNQK